MRCSLWLALSLMMVACDNGTLLHSYMPLPVEGWDRRDTVCFELPGTEEDFNGTLTIGLRTKAQIGIRDVVLAVEQCDEKASVLRRDTVRYSLTDEEGYALSKGVNTHQYETVRLPLQAQKGHGNIRIHHLMMHEILSGITEVGIKVEGR